MNKKFLSAILFGAMMATSAGTFVSCKDYDDDIKGLQEQIDTNKTAIAELQKLVGAGNWVTSVAASGENLVVTMSNGTTATIAGIKGADGKNAAEWTISEDGFWCKDGEKTANVAIAQNGKDGKDGVTAPSPSISANGMWVVYSWDATKGEFVANETEIPAAGTSAYAVKANGVYTLHIADENGEYQEIALPATSDSFVATTPAAIVNVTFEQANWKPVTSKTDKEIFAKMTKAFPELAEYKKGDLMKQGGNLPVIITPANVELTNEFSFSLQSAKGEISEAEISNPVKGMPELARNWGWLMQTRSADANDAFWTLSVEPAKNKKGNGYLDITEVHSLVVENAKGTVVKTAFAYTLTNVDNEDVTITKGLTDVDLSDEIDVLANTEDGAVFTINHGLNGYYLLEATDILEIEKYGITIEGSKLMIANMPADQTSITVDLKLTAVGLNGSVEETETELTIGQAIAVNGTLSDKVETLGYNKAEDSYDVAVRWNIADELKDFSATQLNQFLYNTDKTLTVKYENEEGEMVDADPASVEINAYDKKGNVIAKGATDGYKNAVTFGFNMDSKTWEPGVYAIRLEVETAEDAVIYAAEATLTVENPELGEGDVKLVPGFVDENGVYQITGDYETFDDLVIYSLDDALILNEKVAQIESIIDYDNAQYVEDERDDEAFEMYSLVTPNWVLAVNKWVYETEWTNTAEEWTAYQYNQLYKTRNIRAMLKLFGNENNVVPFDFQVEVKSELYTETVADAVTFDATKLAIEFGAKNDNATTNVDESVIDIKAAITKALVQAGTDKGKTYSLFATSKSVEAGDAVETVYDFSAPEARENMVVSNEEGKDFVELTRMEYLDMVAAFPNTKSDNHEKIKNDEVKYVLSVNAWRIIWGTAENYYNKDGNAKYVTNAEGEDYEFEDGYHFQYSQTKSYKDEDKAKMAVYTTLKSKIAFTVTSEGKADSGETQAVKRDTRIANVTIAFDEPAVAKNYFQSVVENGVVFSDEEGTDYSAITIKPVAEAPNSVTGGQVKVGMTLTIRDAWGMIMEIPFEVTVKTAK